MHRSARVFGALVLVSAGVPVLAGAANGTSASRASGWKVSDLGTLGGNESAATATNNKGQIVGWSTTRTGAKLAFLWENGTMRDLGTLGGTESAALALNERGQIVGWSTSKDGTKKAALWASGVIRALEQRDTIAFGGSVATGINVHGDVSGYWWRKKRQRPDSRPCRGPGGATCGSGLLWRSGSVEGLGMFSQAGWSAAYGLNDDGVIAGSSGRAMFWWQAGNQFADFGPADGVARAVNSHRITVGWTLTGGRRRAFLWSGVYPQRPVLLGTLGGRTSVAYGINSRSQVVGTSAMKRGGAHAFVWAAGAMRDLGTLPGGRSSSAAGIDDRGRIVGSSSTRGGHSHVVIWTPRAAS